MCTTRYMYLHLHGSNDNKCEPKTVSDLVPELS
ncbi:hypothetical protein L914_08474 [Phytophthora nicotianae]|uniref:Uncharacterized protein n=1 Tax=Phytophthora nicotianae TaxID=4792 RepID=W2NDH6_PHYNI|nr:hypothetical protein L914_08474 [Phytophthora nicotianae]